METTAAAPTTIDVTGLPPAVVHKLQQLVRSLRTTPTAQPRPSLLGRFAEPGKEITAEEIDEAQREMWANFPRDFPPPDAP